MDATKIIISVKVEPEDLPLKGNVLASGNDADDAAAEEEIRQRLARDDEWAWCYVIVTATCGEFKGRAALGGVSVKDRADFEQVLLADMSTEAVLDLKEEMGKRAEDAAGAAAKRMLDGRALLRNFKKLKIEVER